MKRIFTLFLAFMILFMLFPSAATAEFNPDDLVTKYALLMDANTGKVLWEKNAHEKAFPASTTKILTSIIALETLKLDEKVTVGENVETKGSLMHITRREELTVRDLLYGTLLISGNDASRALAEHIAGSIADFAVIMNKKAVEIGMNESNFENPNGLHDENHYTTAYDLALCTRYAMQNEDFCTIVNTKTYQVPPTNKDSDGYLLENTNKLLYTKKDDPSYEYKYATGVKTGDTDYAGRCLVASAKKGDSSLIVVLLGDMANKVNAFHRFTAAKDLFEWGFSQCQTFDAASIALPTTIDEKVVNCSFEDPQSGLLTLNIDLNGKKISGLKAEIEEIKSNPAAVKLVPSFTNGDRLSAPIKSGDVVGTVAYQFNGSTLFTAKLTASRDVMQMSTTTLSTEGSVSPLIVGSAEKTASSENSWVFWVILAVLVIVLLLVMRSFRLRKIRRRNARRNLRGRPTTMPSNYRRR